jgi:hypothetical protein
MKKSEREMERTMIKHCLQNSRTMHKRKKSGRRVKSLKKVVQRMKTRLNHFPRTKERRISIRKMYNALIMTSMAILHRSANPIKIRTQRMVTRKQM